MRFLDLIRGSKQEPSRLILQPEGRPFHITIGTVSGDGLDIKNSIRMLRSALLYADQVRLCSFTTSRVLSLFAEYGLGPEEYLEWTQEHVLPHIVDEPERTRRAQTIGYYKELFKRKRQGKHLDRAELQALTRIQYERSKRVEEMRNTHPVLTQGNDISGIQRALRDSLLELDTFKSLDEQDIISKHLSGVDVGGKDVVEEFLSLVTEAIANRATYPLFDDTTGNY